MSRHEETCPHCRAKADGTAPAGEAVQGPIELPTVPTLIRVHNPGFPPMDCTLHPDGVLTAVLGGQTLRSALTFDEMRERNWERAHIEFDPAPLVEEPEPEQSAEVVQEPLALIPTP